MAVPARTIGNETSKTSVTSRSGRFFERAHYEKSIAAMPRARMIMPPARMTRIDGSSIEPTRACAEHEAARDTGR